MSAELGRKRVSQTDPLQQAPQGRALCGLGTAEALFRRGSRRLPVIALVRTSGWAARLVLPNAGLAQCTGAPCQDPQYRLRRSERLRIELRQVPTYVRAGGRP